MLILGSFDYASFVSSVRPIDAAASTVLHEAVWLPTMVVVLARSSGPAALRLNAVSASMVAVGVAGTSAVILSQVRRSALCADGCVLGAVSGVAAGVMSGLFVAGCLLVAWDAAAAVAVPEVAGGSRAAVMLWSHAALAVGATADVAANAALGFAARATQVSLASAAAAALVGAALIGAGSWALRAGHVRSRGLGINAVYGLTPVFALLWLLPAGISLQRVPLFVAGTVVVLAANTVIQLRAF